MPDRMGRVGALVDNCTCVLERIIHCCYCSAICILLGGLAIAAAHAEDSVPFDIKAGPAAESLNEYARQANVELGFRLNNVDSIRTNAVKGRYPAGEALNMLLEGTGLVAKSESRGVIIRRSGEGVDIQPQGASAVEPQRRTSDRTAPTNLTTATRPSQVQASRGDQEATSNPTLEEILVTGTRIRGSEGSSPVITITRQEIERAGYATVEELIDKLPQNYGAGASHARFTDLRSNSNVVGGNVGQVAGGASVNLRGLGASSTLILINGRRISYSGLGAQFVDVSNIPLSAVERVDVLADGGSAIYGADAIAGVVNFILRDDYDGAETRIRYGTDTGGNAAEGLLGQSIGRSWGRGSILAFYEYYHHDNIHNTDRRFAASTDLTALGGTDWRGVGGNPANIIADGRTFAIPRGQNGTSLSPATFDPEAPPNRHDIRAGEDFIPKQERHSVFVSLTQTLAKTTDLFAEARFSSRDNITQFDSGLIDLEVPDTNPFFVDPTGTGLRSVIVDNYSFRNDIGPMLNSGESDVYGAVLGAAIDFGGSWQGELVGTYSKEEAAATFLNIVNRNALATALAASDPEAALNPFGDGSNSTPGVLESLRTGGNQDSSENQLWTAGFSVTGTAMRMPGGLAKLAAGAEYRDESLEVSSIVGSEFGAPTRGSGSDNRRNVFSVYAEMHFPLLGPADGKAGMPKLEVSLAARYEEYNDFGNSTDPKFSIAWKPTPFLRLRGTVGTSFKAPKLTDLDVSNLNINTIVYYPQLFVDLGFIPFPTIFIAGGNENLTAEEATTWTAGFQLGSLGRNGLSLDATYFNVDFKNRIERPFTNILLAYDERFASLLNTSPTESQIATLVNDPRWDEVFGVPAGDVLSGVAEVGGIGDARINNIASSVVTGIDLQLSYTTSARLGELDIGLNANYLFDFKRALISTDPLVDEVGRLGRPVDLRARGSVTWSNGPWAASGFLNYVHSYIDNISSPPEPIGSWITTDLSVGYDASDLGNALNGVRLSLSAQNVFDRDPPFADTIGGLGYDSTNANGRGRFVTAQVTKEW
jgi:outer membrane receptor protein involved in Fe transport